MTEGDAAVCCRQLGVRYGGRAALEGVDLDVAPGCVAGWLGPNGAGKSTLVKALLGLVRPTSGAAWLLGEPIGRARARQRVGYLPENLSLPAHYDARRALDHCAMLQGLDPAPLRARGAELLERLGLSADAGRPLRGYSKGMRQRLGLAQALLHGPDLLFLDEPTDGIDPAGRTVVAELIREEARRGATVVLCSHLLAEVEPLCDRVAILDGGRLLRAGSPTELERELFPALRYRAALARPIDPAQLSQPGVIVRAHATGQLDVELASLDVLPALVDALRPYGLVELVRWRPSLVDAYLALVGTPAERSA